MALADETHTRSICVPDEIVIEILSRLPAKSVLRLRLVRKSLASLIFDTQFVNKHLSNSSNRKHILFHRMGGDDSGTFQFPLESINPQSRRCSESRIQFPEPYLQCFVVGSCNGLVCLYFVSSYRSLAEFILWNPSTGDCTGFPTPWRGHRDAPFHACGFGYDDSTSDYKVLIKSCSYADKTASVYTLSNNSWKRVPYSSAYRFRHYRGGFANGVLHWVAIRYDTDFSYEHYFIICFDLRTETFKELHPPICVDASLGGWRGYDAAVELGVIEGYLSYVDRWHDVWIMKEYGVAESWTKILSFPSYKGFPRCDSIDQLLCLPKDGEVLIHMWGLLGFYNAEEKTLKYVVNDFGLFKFSGNIIVYTDSLVSPRVRDQTETQTTEVEEWFSILNHMFSSDF